MDEGLQPQNLLLQEILNNQRDTGKKIDDLTSKVAFREDIQEIKEAMKEFALRRDLDAHKMESRDALKSIETTLEEFKANRWPAIAKTIGGSVAAAIILSLLFFMGQNFVHTSVPTTIQTMKVNRP
jgi:hypothetical protein